jgi:putative flippase GtrA
MQTQQQLVKFIMVGGLNTLFGYSCYALFVYLGMPYPVALLLATCLGVLFNFKTTGKLVFASENNDYFLMFVMVYGVVYLFNMALIKFMELFTSNLYLAGFVAAIPAAMMAFVLNKYMVFRERYETN